LTEMTVIELGRRALWTVLLVAGPILGLALITGLLVSIFQATTQVQEQTLTFVPKLFAVLGATILFGPWMVQTLLEFAGGLLANMHLYIG
jgi:flagellar biosynthetic protein FliQ